MSEQPAGARSSSCPTDYVETGSAAEAPIQGGLDDPLALGQRSISTESASKVSTKLRVLLVEDNSADVELVLFTLRRDGFDVIGDVAQTIEEFTSRIQATAFDVILADYNLPQWRGIEGLGILCRENQDVPLIVVTGYLSEEEAMECVRQGATDCVLKHHIARLPASVRRALEETRLRKQRHQFEVELARKAAELARSNAELEQFAYVASHDLQEPLRMIANYTQLLAERYRGRLDEQADKYIGYSVDGAVRLQALIRDLLKFSRVGRAEIELKPTDCGVVVEQALKNLRAAVQESGAVVNCNVLPRVMAEPSQLTQVFQNLIGNAIKFRGSRTPVVKIDAEKKDGEWRFSVSDNGIGIPVESWQDVFIIFRRLHTRAEYSGNGIGLAISKKVIERHGGKLWIEAPPEPGSCFKFTLPAEPGSNADEETEA